MRIDSIIGFFIIKIMSFLINYEIAIIGKILITLDPPDIWAFLTSCRQIYDQVNELADCIIFATKVWAQREFIQSFKYGFLHHNYETNVLISVLWWNHNCRITADDNNNTIILFDWLEPNYGSYGSGEMYSGILAVNHLEGSQSPYLYATWTLFSQCSSLVTPPVTLQQCKQYITLKKLSKLIDTIGTGSLNLKYEYALMFNY